MTVACNPAVEAVPLRRFKDREDRMWEAVLGRASWGAHTVLFVPVGHASPVRQTDLSASTIVDAMDEIERADDAELRGLLDMAKIREE